jgi:hypothetical protein
MSRIGISSVVRIFVVLFLVAMVCAPHANAAIRPSFNLDFCTWNATHIVVATEGDEIDGRLTVLESWKGDLRSGDVVAIPELASFKSKSSRELKSGILGLTSYEPKKYVTGSRMILFLKKKEPSSEPSNNNTKISQAPDRWEPASQDGFNVSVLWIEGDQAFAFVQLMNPGPSLLTNYELYLPSGPAGGSEKQIRDRAFDVMRIQETANAAVAMQDESKRAEALVPFALSELYYARNLAFAELQKCGKAALPVLRTMLGDQTFLKLHGEVIKAMAEVGGEEVADELTDVVRVELLFWKETGPRLRHGWWNNINESETDNLRNRYSKVLGALYSLRKLKPIGCKEVVSEFRDFWRSLPQLEDKSGLDQMSEACDRVLQELGR